MRENLAFQEDEAAQSESLYGGASIVFVKLLKLVAWGGVCSGCRREAWRIGRRFCVWPGR